MSIRSRSLPPPDTEYLLRFKPDLDVAVSALGQEPFDILRFSIDQIPVSEEAHDGGQVVMAHVGQKNDAAWCKSLTDLREDRHGGRGIKVIQEPRKHDILAGRKNPLVF